MELLEVGERRGIPTEWFVEIIDGCRMDLQVNRFGSWEELEKYNWKVAGIVGLISTRIFGCVHENSDNYARVLGNALQLTNILRDVGEDLRNGGRIYLPINDLIRFQYSERDLIGKVYDGRFLAMMEWQAGRAEHHFAEAERILPEQDRGALMPAQMMAEVYGELLQKMRGGRFQVFDRRYSLSKGRKVAILFKYILLAKMTK